MNTSIGLTHRITEDAMEDGLRWPGKADTKRVFKSPKLGQFRVVSLEWANEILRFHICSGHRAVIYNV